MNDRGTAAQAAEQLYETVPCNLCGGTDTRIIYAGTPRDRHDWVAEFQSSADERLREPLVACAACGLQFVNPRLRPDVILAGYAEGADETFVSQADARVRTFERALARLGRYATPPGRLLDVGTAGGSFLFAARRQGWTVAGCEPSRWLCNWAREHYGIDVAPGTLFEQRYAEASFDAVTLWDVLEHTPDPAAVVRECRRVLKPSGVLVVNYPDIGSWIARLMGRRWVFLLSVHLYYFTPDTIRALLTQAGYTVEEIRPHVQYLQLGYILKRAEETVGGIARLAGAIARVTGLSGLQVPYWIGQTLVVARRDS